MQETCGPRGKGRQQGRGSARDEDDPAATTISGTVAGWLGERKELLVHYHTLTDPDPDSSPASGSAAITLEAQLKQFCQILMDYVSAGHFEVYELLIRHAGPDDTGVRQSLEALSANMQVCLDFNDTCEKLSSVAALHRALSALGEILEERFQLEDRLLNRAGLSAHPG